MGLIISVLIVFEAVLIAIWIPAMAIFGTMVLVRKVRQSKFEIELSDVEIPSPRHIATWKTGLWANVIF